MNKLPVLMLTANAVLAVVPAYAGRDAAQLYLQEKANKEVAARRQCVRDVTQLLEQRLQEKAPLRVPSTDEARADEAKREEEIARCIEKLKKAY